MIPSPRRRADTQAAVGPGATSPPPGEPCPTSYPQIKRPPETISSKNSQTRRFTSRFPPETPRASVPPRESHRGPRPSPRPASRGHRRSQFLDSPGGSAHATPVVWIETPGASPARQPGRAVLDQRNLTFLPHVLAVQVGTTVEFPNNDRVFHNVFSFRNGKRFDLGLYPVGAVRKLRFDQAGVSRLFCNIHPNTAGYVVAVDSAHFAVADRNGTFRLGEFRKGHSTIVSGGREEKTLKERSPSARANRSK